MLIGELLARRARVSPEALFWEEPGASWRYGEFDRAVNQVARALLAEGLPPGATIAIHSTGSAAYAQVHFAAARAGLVLAHLNAQYTAPELAWGLRHSGAALLFFGAEQAATVDTARAHAAGLARFVCLDDEAAPPWAKALGDFTGPFSHAPLPPLPDTVTEEAPFQLLYTSGTTGVPKGALIPHRAKLRLGLTHALNLALEPGDRVFGALPMHHHYAQWLLLTAVPLVGASVVFRRRFDAEEAWAALAGGGITHLPAVPTTLERLLRAAPDRPPLERAPLLRRIVFGGAACPPSIIPRLRESFPSVRLFQGFGQTETGYCLGLHDHEQDAHSDSLGRPDLFSRLRLVDDDGRDVPDGEVGEIIASTPYLMCGYRDAPEDTAKYFCFGREWGRTGDLARRDEEGYYYLAGRKTELIITGGVNVYPAEIERILLTHPAVAEAAVYGTPHPDWGEAVTAALILRPDFAATSATAFEASLQEHCRRHLAPFKIPKSIRIVADFPRTSSGKVKKQALLAHW